MGKGGEAVGERYRTTLEQKLYQGMRGSVRGTRVRPADCLVLLHEVNKLHRSKASWSSIIPKWEVGKVERWSEGKRREGRKGLQSGMEESRSRSAEGELCESKWTVNGLSRKQRMSQKLSDLVLIPRSTGCLLDGRAK